MKFPDDFEHIVYDDTPEEVQKTIDEFIAVIRESNGETDKIATGNVQVEKIGEKYFVTVRSDCWILKPSYGSQGSK